MAQGVKDNESLNLQRAREALDEEDYEKAEDFLWAEINDVNPTNGYAYYELSEIYRVFELYDDAIEMADEALKLLPKRDKVFKSEAYSTRGVAYLELGDTVRGVADLEKSIDLNETYYALRQLGYVYAAMGNYAKSDEFGRKMIEMDPMDSRGELRLGMNAYYQEQYETAALHFDKAINIDNKYWYNYVWRAENNVSLKRYEAAVDDAIQSIYLYDAENGGYSNYSIAILDSVANIDETLVFPRLKIEENKDDYYLMPLVAGEIYEGREQYADAIKMYKEALNRAPKDSYVAYSLALPYVDLQLFEEALKYIDIAIENDTTDAEYRRLRGDLNSFLLRKQEAVVDYTAWVKAEPENYSAYQCRGNAYHRAKDIDAALDDYSACLSLCPENSWARLLRGFIYMNKGEQARARLDFEIVVDQDTILEKMNGAPLALYFLGQKEKATQLMQAALKASDDVYSNYLAALLYSVMGDCTSAMTYLRAAMEKGYYLRAAKMDPLFENLWSTDEFVALQQEFEEKIEKRRREVLE